MNIFTAVCCAVFLYLIMRNTSAWFELRKHTSKDPLYVMKDTRILVKVGRIFCLVCMLIVIGFYLYDITHSADFFDADAFRPLALVLGFAFFAFVPFSTSRWVITNEGVYLYNSNRFVPWSEMINTGINRKSKTHTILVINTKRASGEMFKQTFYMLRITPEDAENVRQMISEFIRTLDKMKRLKHVQEERALPKKKRTWY